ncbi:MAG: RluA family pseudouridine synthase [Gemmatimonadaceae bacterium]|nr:RluA family pseudouridine synthase [Gemmatimonadaceae bacterium]
MTVPRAEARTHTAVATGDGQRLDLVVATAADLSRTQAATLIAAGQVTVDGRAEKAGYRPRAGETIAITIPAPRGIEVAGEAIPLDIVYEDEVMLVVNKPAGMVVHPAPGNWTGTLVNALVGRGGALSGTAGAERAGIVHRLDKETSGLLLVAKEDRAHRALSAALAARRVSRRYAALSWGHLREDRLTIEAPLARDPRDRRRVAVVASGRHARTDITRLARFDAGDLLRCRLHTGRTHQIRVHLQSIGHPVLGDDTYGGGGGRRLTGLPQGRHALHAASLHLRHPLSGEPLRFHSPLPADLDAALRAVAGPYAPAPGADALGHFGFWSDEDDALPVVHDAGPVDAADGDVDDDLE